MFCFVYCTSLTKVIIPKGITEIKQCAFDGNISLGYVELPDGLKSIEFNAFYDNNLVAVFIPDSVESIDKHAFLHHGHVPVNLLFTEQCKAYDDILEAYSWRFCDYTMRLVASREDAEKYYILLEFFNQ